MDGPHPLSLSLPDTGKLFSDDVSAAPSLTDHNHSGKKSSPLQEEEEAASSRRELPFALSNKIQFTSLARVFRIPQPGLFLVCARVSELFAQAKRLRSPAFAEFSGA
jgi:hypothetical protein